MVKLLLLGAFSLVLSHNAFADTAKKEETKVEAPAKEVEKSAKSISRDEKKAAQKAERAHKVLTTCESNLKDSEEKGKALTGVDKKMFDLSVAHAKLEMTAAEDVDMKDHSLKHARLCKRYMADAHKYLKHTDKEPAKEEKK